MTTLIIDRKEGLVLSDSRGAQENEIANWKLLPLPRLERTITKDYTTVQKIYAFNSHVIVGCGSLELLEKFAHKIRFFNFTFRHTYYHRSEFDLDNTTVYINNRTLGDIHTLELKIKPIKIGFGWYKLNVSKAAMKKRYTFNGEW